MLAPSGPADRKARQALPWPGGELDSRRREHTLGLLRAQATAAPLLAIQSPVPQPGSKAHTGWKTQRLGWQLGHRGLTEISVLLVGINTSLADGV